VDVIPSLGEALPPVRADAEQLLQVFLNLALNAVQAMPEGGRLFVSSSIRRATRRGAAAAFLEVRFRDTGVGIPPGDLRNLFIPFFTTKEKGTGLGLPISQRIIENHGGTIEVRSQMGSGATFTVLLPVESDAYAAYVDKKPALAAPPRPAATLPGAATPPPLLVAQGQGPLQGQGAAGPGMRGLTGSSPPPLPQQPSPPSGSGATAQPSGTAARAAGAGNGLGPTPVASGGGAASGGSAALAPPPAGAGRASPAGQAVGPASMLKKRG
jgi:hypothetical protein